LPGPPAARAGIGPERAAGGWNHTIHYHGLLLDALPRRCGVGLYVGCGDGLLTRALAARADRVVGADIDRASVARARHEVAGLAHVEIVEADAMVEDLSAFAPGGFDAVVSLAMLHHVDLESGLQRLAGLVAPTGVLAIVGLARSRSARDLFYDAMGALATRALRWRRRHWEHAAPIVEPTASYTDVYRTASRLLPGCRLRRHVLFRYSIVWCKPA
jgi:SAM-dependent methyltransferase